MKILTGLIIIGACGYIIAQVGEPPSSSSSNKSSKSAGSRGDARYDCEYMTKRYLKSPSTADFDFPQITKRGNGEWTLRGDVHAQNSFGAMLKNTYACDVAYTPGKTAGKVTYFQFNGKVIYKAPKVASRREVQAKQLAKSNLSQAKRVQKLVGATPDGKIGPVTKAKMLAYCEKHDIRESSCNIHRLDLKTK